jgi:nicotinamide-nucleotide amidase
MPSLEIVAVGTEILLGDLIDTNSAHVARTLAAIGVDVFAKHAVGDNVGRIAAMLHGVLDRADGAIVTGGLGPTVDDLTREAVAEVMGVPLVLDEASLDAIAARFASLRRTMTENNRRQALVPQGAHILVNPNGTAPGFIAVRADGRFIATMPGVPAEMKPMLADSIVPWLVQRYALEGGIVTRTLHTVGIAESEIDRRIHDLFEQLENPKIAVLAHMGRVDIRIMAKARSRTDALALIAPVEADVRERVADGYFGTDDETLEASLVRVLTESKRTIATAESVTGGGIADAIVSIPGASAAFRGGIVAYDNALKETLLDVDPALIDRHGAVSEEVAIAMARGARIRCGSDFAIATTGIAGPAGATETKPVGLVWFCVSGPDGDRARSAILPGDRTAIRRRAVAAAIDMAWRYVKAQESVPS